MATVADRVKETATTTGTGNLTLVGAPSGYRTFDNAVGQNVIFTYTIAHQSANEWEVGEGYLSAATTLVRNTVFKSSNSNALVNFSAGTKDVFITVTADEYQSNGVLLAMRMGLAGS